MSTFERPPSISDSISDSEAKSDQEKSPSLELFDELKQQAFEDQELSELFQQLNPKIDAYVAAKRRHVQYSESRHHREEEGQFYEQKRTEREKSRYEAHNDLINLLRAFAARSKELHLDTAWWDGSNGFDAIDSHTSMRRKVDDWAMDIWLNDIEQSETEGD